MESKYHPMPTNRTNFKTNNWRETFCFCWLVWDSVAVLKRLVLLCVLMQLPRDVFEVLHGETRLKRMGFRLKNV